MKTTLKHTSIALILLTFFSQIATWQPVQAETDTAAPGVNTFNDEIVTGDNLCSLREAIRHSTDCPAGMTTIQLAVGTYQIELTGSGNKAAGDFDVDTNLTISGQGPDKTTIQEVTSDRVFLIGPGVQAKIQNLTITGGSAHGSSQALGGGGILNYGDLTLEHVMIYSNTTDYIGGGIDNRGSVTLNNVTLDSNIAARNAGGISNSGTLVVTNSTFAGNTGGKSANDLDNQGDASLTNVTLTNQSASTSNLVKNEFGGIFNDGSSLSFVNVTLGYYHHNTQVAEFVNNGTSTAVNSLFLAETPDSLCAGTGSLTSLGSNLASDNSCKLNQSTDQVSNQIDLGPLQDNGGPTYTRLIGSGSPAVDKGDNSKCPAKDQRDVVRPLDGDGDGTPTCDIGAVEIERKLRVFLPVVLK